MDPNQLRNYLEQLLALTDNSLPGGQGPVASVVRTLVQQAQFDGPLRLIGGPPSVSDIATFYTHLHSLSQLLNTLHDPKGAPPPATREHRLQHARALPPLTPHPDHTDE